MKTLTSDEVVDRVVDKVPHVLNGASRPRLKAKDTINLAYYGYVFDASGYGYAARAYIHALYSAGIELSVVDLARHRRQVADPLVESLAGRALQADFHLFHGIPPQWARLAFPLRNVIAVTVWETDTMPSQWRPALSHALEVWLPCEFNTAVFSRSLGKPAFKLPHPLLPCVTPDAETFTEAESFLDAGCAKGFLVRALCELGKECRGLGAVRLRTVLKACLKNRFRVAQATRLCRPATRRTERQQRFEPIGTAFSQGCSLPFRSASRRPGRASRPRYPFFRQPLSLRIGQTRCQTRSQAFCLTVARNHDVQ